MADNVFNDDVFNDDVFNGFLFNVEPVIPSEDSRTTAGTSSAGVPSDAGYDGGDRNRSDFAVVVGDAAVSGINHTEKVVAEFDGTRRSILMDRIEEAVITTIEEEFLIGVVGRHMQVRLLKAINAWQKSDPDRVTAVFTREAQLESTRMCIRAMRRKLRKALRSILGVSRKAGLCAEMEKAGIPTGRIENIKTLLEGYGPYTLETILLEGRFIEGRVLDSTHRRRYDTRNAMGFSVITGYDDPGDIEELTWNEEHALERAGRAFTPRFEHALIKDEQGEWVPFPEEEVRLWAYGIDKSFGVEFPKGTEALKKMLHPTGEHGLLFVPRLSIDLVREDEVERYELSVSLFPYIVVETRKGTVALTFSATVLQYGFFDVCGAEKEITRLIRSFSASFSSDIVSPTVKLVSPVTGRVFTVARRRPVPALVLWEPDSRFDAPLVWTGGSDEKKWDGAKLLKSGEWRPWNVWPALDAALREAVDLVLKDSRQWEPYRPVFRNLEVTNEEKAHLLEIKVTLEQAGKDEKEIRKALNKAIFGLLRYPATKWLFDSTREDGLEFEIVYPRPGSGATASGIWVWIHSGRCEQGRRIIVSAGSTPSSASKDGCPGLLWFLKDLEDAQEDLEQANEAWTRGREYILDPALTRLRGYVEEIQAYKDLGHKMMGDIHPQVAEFFGLDMVREDDGEFEHMLVDQSSDWTLVVFDHEMSELRKLASWAEATVAWKIKLPKELLVHKDVGYIFLASNVDEFATKFKGDKTRVADLHCAGWDMLPSRPGTYTKLMKVTCAYNLSEASLVYAVWPHAWESLEDEPGE